MQEIINEIDVLIGLLSKSEINWHEKHVNISKLKRMKRTVRKEHENDEEQAVESN